MQAGWAGIASLAAVVIVAGWGVVRLMHATLWSRKKRLQVEVRTGAERRPTLDDESRRVAEKLAELVREALREREAAERQPEAIEREDVRRAQEQARSERERAEDERGEPATDRSAESEIPSISAPDEGATEWEWDIPRDAERRIEATYGWGITGGYRDQQEEEARVRALNARFRDRRARRDLLATEALLATRRYDLLVDVGPLSQVSIVTGVATFPEQVLPKTDDGHELSVVFISDDFTPPLTTAKLWLPRNGGPSIPILGRGYRAAKPGPVSLRLRAPRIRGLHSTARGRLSVYYENTLLQSAAVRANVVLSPVVLPPDHPNAVEVDYVLTTTFGELGEEFATRDVRLVPDAFGPAAVRASITLNDDGAGGHRIIAKAAGGASTAPPGWTRYNPVAAKRTLGDSRQALIDCFWRRDKDGRVIPDDIGLDADNGKGYDAFRYDLRALAELGAKLFAVATGEADAEVQSNAVPLAASEWVRLLRAGLREAGVIQIARTVQASYAFPWALVYDIPMPGPRADVSFCRVVTEWLPHGRRRGQLRAHCPFRDAEWHRENVYCPYGFWGLRHIVEQPPSAMRRRADGTWEVRNLKNREASDHFDIATAITTDDRLDASSISAHIDRIGALRDARLQPRVPASDVVAVRDMLGSAPSVVYILCHGERDEKHEPFLGVGLRDGAERHRIYPITVRGWKDSDSPPNLAAWARWPPFVFINGCHTFDLDPAEVLSFVSEFTYAQAAGLLGTEVSVLLPVATEVAEAILGMLATGVPIGQALRDVRWALADKGNLLGLAYTLYALADFRVVSSGSSLPTREPPRTPPPQGPAMG